MKRVKIGGHTYRIRRHDAWMDAQNDTLGSVVFNRQEILLDTSPEITKSRRDETLLHEIIEALNYHSELNLPHPTMTVLSESLYQVLVDNDGFWRKKK